MSFKGRDITQGGQVTFMRFRMFLQVNNILFYYVFIGWLALLGFILYLRLNTQTFLNGLVYWWSHTLIPFGSIIRKPPVYPVRYYGNTLYYTYDKILTDKYTVWCGITLRNEFILSGLLASIITFAVVMGVFWYIGRVGKKASEDEVTGGRILEDNPKVVARLMRRRGTASHIVIDGLPIVKDSEIQNFAMHGTVGTGKSTLMRKKLHHLREAGVPVIIYDKGNTFVEEFYDESIDIILNPMDRRCANWDMWAECQTLPDLEAVTETLIPMGNSGDPFWQGSARTIFAEGAEQMRGDKKRTYNSFLRTLLAIKLDKLRDFLAGTPASTLVDGSIEKTAISIRSVLTNYVKSLRYLQGIDREGKKPFTIREWMQGNSDKKRSGWLFITSNQRHHESLKPLISMWLGIASGNLLSLHENRYRRVWFFYDELPSLHKLPNLPYIIAEARKYGGCFVLGFQSYAQLEETYGPKFAAAIYDLLNTKYFFRSPSAAIAKFVEEDIGQTVRKRFTEQTSFGTDEVRDGISYGKDEERVSIVSYSDVQGLEDLQCFVTLPGKYPVVRLTLKYQPLPKVAEGLLERDVKTSLDPEIEQEISQQESSERLAARKLFIASDTQGKTDAALAGNSVNVPPAPAVAGPDSSSSGPSAEKPDVADKPARGGGRENEIPHGISTDGEVIDMEAYEAWQQEMQHGTRDEVRREEVNINHHPSHEIDMEL
ncbi:type IV conjugative transfer system coupling protein TraD [Salmonella enterica subsp. enterica]|nr:type IV conjugative transfer system coupling protein TraD [Salmonella enterica subsp. enterica serovar Vitkin]ECA1912389.1 type IV conjugative transfer system coupling protein TraD [Salmonella enterica subsp. enterica serovar Vitkin]ECV7438484.1 type IV conjugative transfer system coupling protein TraD [Salmonella enterica subsp. enterica serovar Newport]EDD8831923.1 type IV conjugative transfer system coupling protein TraD [Salmonella enterica subsp. enterica serovar Mikawasima]EEC0866160.1